MKKILKNLIDDKIIHIIIGGILINALCFFIFSINTKASPLPTYLDVNDAPFSISQAKEIYAQYGEYQNVTPLFDSNLCLMYLQENSNGGQIYYFYIINTANGVTLNGIPYKSFDTEVNHFNWEFYAYRLSYFINSNGDLSYTGMDAVNRQYSIAIYGGYAQPLLLKENLKWGEYDLIILGTRPQGSLAVPPDFDSEHYFYNGNSSPIYPAGTTQPANVPPSYTVNNYTWNTYTPPPFDNSSTTDALESLGDIISYGFNYLTSNLQGEFSNLISNINGGISFLGNTIRYYGDLIIGNIQMGIDNIYQNFNALLTLLNDFFEMVLHPFDAETMQAQLNSSDFIGAVRTTKTEITTFFGAFSNIQQPQNVIFEIDLTDLWFNGGVSYLDFSIISPVLPFIRLVLGCILIYSLIVTIVTNINTYIGGNSAKNDGGG